jgi:hypothetical protein
MNRRERRQFAKHHRGDTPYHTYLKTLMPEAPEPLDTSQAYFCWMHHLKLENPKNPTAHDKSVIDGVRLRPLRSVDPKTGEVKLGRCCPRCGNVVFVDREKSAVTEPSLEGYTTKDDKVILSP